MRHPGYLFGGLFLFGGGLALGLVRQADALNPGVRYASTVVLVVIGILCLLAALKKDEGAAFDPGDTINEHPWSNEEQPWSIGEALGMSLWTFKKAGGRLALLTLLMGLGSGIAWLGLPIVVLVVSLFSKVVDHGDGPIPATIRGVSQLLSASARALADTPGTALVALVLFLAVLHGGTLAFGGPFFKEILAALRGSRITFEHPSAARRIPRLFAFGFVYAIAVCVLPGPFSLLVVPFSLTPFFIVDQGLSIGSALKKSWNAASDHFGKLWLFHAALLPLGVFCAVLPFGGLIYIPMFWGGLGYAYARSTGRIGMPYFPPEAASRFSRSLLRVTVLALTALFAGLVYWVENLPKLRGSAWNVQDFAIRVSTIVTGVVLVISLLGLLLPYILDQLEGRRFTSFVAARHVRSQKSGFLTVISILSICGVAISSCALFSVVSVMGGFSQDLKRKILGNNAHIVVDTTPGTPFGDYEATLDKIRKIPGVVGATPVVHGEVMASSSSNLAGVVVTGIEPETIQSVIELGRNIEVGSIDYLEHPEKLTRLPPQTVIGIGPGGEQYFKGTDLPGLPDDIDPEVRAVIVDKADRPGVILGRELAKTLHVYVGDEVTLVSPLGDLGPMGVMPRTKKFRVAAIFYSGMYEYDAMSVYTMLDVAQDYFQTARMISAIDVKVEDAELSDRIAPEVQNGIDRAELRVRDWREINKNLFSALKLERFATFLILSIAIMVASFCIVCTLLLMVTEKGKEIAILKAIGASDGAILRIFIIEGMIIGGIGTAFGMFTGLAVCTGLSWFGLRLDPDVYYIDRLPIAVNASDFFIVAIAAVTICTLSTLYPAYAASQLRPVDGLRDA